MRLLMKKELDVRSLKWLTYQKMMVTTAAPIQAMFLIILVFHVIPVLLQTTSSG